MQVGKYIILINNDGTTTIYLPGTYIKHNVPIESLIDNYIQKNKDKFRSIIQSFESLDVTQVTENDELLSLVPFLPDHEELAGNLPEHERMLRQRRDLLVAYNKKYNTNLLEQELPWFQQA